MAESNKMKDMPVNKLMVQMGIPMILSMALQAVDTGISGSDAYGSSWNWNRSGNQCTSCKNTWSGK